MNLFKTKVGSGSGANSIDLMTLGVAGLTKYFEERALTPIVGNGTLMSGAVKLGASLVLRNGNNSIMQGASIGFAVDGMEDVLKALLEGNVTSSGGASSGVTVI